MDLSIITRKIEEELSARNSAVITETVDSKKVKALGLKTALLPGSYINSDDPFGEAWAERLARYVAMHLCGPSIGEDPLVKDPIPLCEFNAISSRYCEEECAPILMIDEGSIWSFYPPCHAKESPACTKYVNNTNPCVMIKAAGCKVEGNAYSVAYSLLDISAREYVIHRVLLYTGDKVLVDVYAGGVPKARDEIMYLYLRIDFPYDIVLNEGTPE